MKSRFFTVFFSFLLSLPVLAQQNTFKRNIKFTTFGTDSIRLTFDNDYYLIEDSCAQIIRNIRFDFQDKKYMGEFKDVVNGNSSFVIASGGYIAGQKNGEFIEYYFNGHLLGKGNFKNDKYAGKWEFYFEDGQPQLTFEVKNNDVYFSEAWDDKHKKMIDNGSGTYKIKTYNFEWSGKILNGRPNGAWVCTNSQNKDEPPIAIEHFVDGHFASGKNFSGIYTDSSRITLVRNNMLPMLNAEQLKISATGCNVMESEKTITNKVINAQYEYGNDDFSDQIKQAAGDYISRLRGHGSITITGEVNEKGALVNLQNIGTYSSDLNSKDLMVLLERLPLLNPATLNGKPVKQGFIITFNINAGLYSFSYKFLPISFVP